MTAFMIDKTCCNKKTSVPSEQKNCLEKWKFELIKVSNKFNGLAAETSGAQAAYNSSLAWETKLNNWVSLIKTTDGKAGEVVNTLQFFFHQIDLICVNSKSTVEALEKITCLVKTIFNKFYNFGTNQLGLKFNITDLKSKVECSKVNEAAKAEVIKCIEGYEQKIIIVYEFQNAIMSKLLETLNSVVMLHTYFCDEEFGLKQKITKMITDFENGLPQQEHCGCGHHEGHMQHDLNQEYPCNMKNLKPKPKFRIGIDNDYYCEIKKAYELSVNKTKNLKDEWVKRKEKSDEKLSRKISLMEAIKAAEAAGNGK